MGPAGPVGPQGPVGGTGPVGPAGPNGPNGATGPIGPVGPQGATGIQGAQGSVGPPGTGLVLSGVVSDPSALPVSPPAGTAYFVLSTGTVYAYDPVNGWEDLGALQGPTGATGSAGPAGPVGPQGATGTAGAQGPAGPQGSQGPTGAQGPQGSGIAIAGVVSDPTGLPVAATNGTVYFVQSNTSLYVFSNGTWYDMGLATGPPGPTGATGAQGATGATGPAGTPGQLQTPWLSDEDAASFTLRNAAGIGIGNDATVNPDGSGDFKVQVGSRTGATPGGYYMGMNGGSGTTLSIGNVNWVNYAIAAVEKRVATLNGDLDGATNNGLFRIFTQNAGTLAERLRVNHLGNVGVGNTASVFPDAGTTKLVLIVGNTAVNQDCSCVVANYSTATGGELGEFVFANYAISATEKRMGIIQSAMDGASNSGYMALWTMASGVIAERMRITSGGYVCVATGAPVSPLCQLEVYTPGVTALRLRGGTTTVNNVQLRFYGANAATDLWAIGPDVTTNNGSKNFHIDDVVNGRGWVTIQQGTGNVGLNQLTPTAQLHVYGAGQPSTGISTTGALGGAIYLQDSGGGQNNGGLVMFGAVQGAFAAIKSLIENGASNTTGDLSFQLRRNATDASLTECLHIYSTGVVNADTYLQVAGNGVAGSTVDSGGLIRVTNVGNVASSGAGAEFYYNPTLNGGTAFFQAFDRGASAAKNVEIYASAIDLHATTGSIVLDSLPGSNPGAGTHQLWYDPTDSNRVKFAA